MADLIDEEGRVLGLVNVVDLFVALLVVAFLVAGIAFVISEGNAGDEPTTETETETPETTTIGVQLRVESVPPYVASAIPEGAVDSEDVVRVRSKTVSPAMVVVTDAEGQLHERPHPRLKTAVVRLDLVVAGAEPTFRGTPVEVGRRVTVDLGPVTVTGNLTDVTAGTT